MISEKDQDAMNKRKKFAKNIKERTNRAYAKTKKESVKAIVGGVSNMDTVFSGAAMLFGATSFHFIMQKDWVIAVGSGFLSLSFFLAKGRFPQGTITKSFIERDMWFQNRGSAGNFSMMCLVAADYFWTKGQIVPAIFAAICCFIFVVLKGSLPESKMQGLLKMPLEDMKKEANKSTMKYIVGHE